MTTQPTSEMIEAFARQIKEYLQRRDIAIDITEARHAAKAAIAAMGELGSRD